MSRVGTARSLCALQSLAKASNKMAEELEELKRQQREQREQRDREQEQQQASAQSRSSSPAPEGRGEGGGAGWTAGKPLPALTVKPRKSGRPKASESWGRAMRAVSERKGSPSASRAVTKGKGRRNSGVGKPSGDA